MSFYARISGGVYRLDGQIAATPIEHALALKSAGDEPYYEAVSGFPETLLVQLHSWSGTKDQCLTTPLLGTIENCVWVCPNFGGPNNHPEGANHPAQMERIKRVIDAAVAEYAPKRIIAVGVSGGAGTAYYMLGYFPGLLAGVSAWVGCNDLAAWYAEEPGFRADLEACFGGPPAGREAEYLARSPKGVLGSARNAIVYVNSGLLDDQIPPHHSADMRDQLTGLPGVDCRYVAYPEMGHAIDYPTAVAQIRQVIAETG